MNAREQLRLVNDLTAAEAKLAEVRSELRRMVEDPMVNEAAALALCPAIHRWTDRNFDPPQKRPCRFHMRQARQAVDTFLTAVELKS